MQIMHTVVFRRDKWTKSKARTWLKNNSLKYSKVHSTPNTYRYLQNVAQKDVTYTTIQAGKRASDGVSYIIYFTKA